MFLGPNHIGLGLDPFGGYFDDLFGELAVAQRTFLIRTLFCSFMAFSAKTLFKLDGQHSSLFGSLDSHISICINRRRETISKPVKACHCQDCFHTWGLISPLEELFTDPR